MSKPLKKVPSYRFHKATGQAVVTLSGRDVYLGPHNSEESLQRYQTAIAQWLASCRMAPRAGTRNPSKQAPDLTLNEIYLPYEEFINQHYRKYGKMTSEVASIKRALASASRTLRRDRRNVRAMARMVIPSR